MLYKVASCPLYLKKLHSYIIIIIILLLYLDSRLFTERFNEEELKWTELEAKRLLNTDLSVRLHVAERLTLVEFSWSFMFGIFTKIFNVFLW